MPGLMVNGGHGSGSSRKRSRQNLVDDDSDEEIVDVQEASSSFRRQDQSQRKRVRVSDIVSEAGPSKYRQSPDNDDSDDDDVDVQDAPAADSDEEPDAMPQSQYEEMRDGGFEHLQYEEQDDMRATQRIQNRAQIVGENRVAENGILESIECFNFMCHTRLHCELGPLLNFIVGENGSGKSAILTAITLCLGGKASSTNRGGSLKTFVKEGTDQAVLRVKIKNQGIDAYQPDVYGDSITVERSFTRGGTSGFKLKSANDRIISRKKDDVNEIVEYYCLQVDNPLNVLSQDNARQFLNASSASLKYKYFIQGVQLEQLDKDYALIKEYLDNTEAKIPEQEERVRVAKGAYDSAKKLHQLIKDNDELRRRRRNFEQQLTWSQVVEQERILKDYRDKIQDTHAYITNAEQVVAQTTAALATVEKKIDAENRQLPDLLQAQAEADERAEQAKEEADNARKSQQELLTNQRDVMAQISSCNKNIQNAENNIREEEQRLQASNGNVIKETQDRLDIAKGELVNIESSIADATAQIPRLEDDRKNAEIALNAANKELGEKRRYISIEEDKIQNLKRGSGSPYDAYDPKVPQLLKLIANDGGFSMKPIGPFGSLIQLTKPSWSQIIEKSLGGSLNSFLVANKGDQQRLLSMMQRLGIRGCQILIGNCGAPLNTDGREPAEEFDTILRVLKFDNHHVRDQLIITGNIEQIILVEDRREAEGIMFKGAAPQNVKACLCHHDGKRGHGLRLTNRAGNISTTTVQPYNGTPRLRSNVDDQVSVIRGLLDQHTADLREIQARHRQHQQKKLQVETSLRTNKSEANKLRTKKRLAEAQVSTIEAELDEFDGADGRLQGLRTLLAEHQEKKEQYGNQAGTMMVSMDEKKAEVARLNAASQQCKEVSKDCAAKVLKIQTKLRSLDAYKKVAIGKDNDAHREQDMFRDDLERLQVKEGKQVELVESFIQQATEQYPNRVHIAEGETHASVEKKLDAVNKQIEQRRARIGMSDVEVNNQVLETNKQYERSKAVLDVSKEQIMGMKQGLMSRLEKWRIFQRYISASSRTNFIYLLSERGFRGAMILDHQRKMLQVNVEPDETRKRSSARSTKTLSGGEKSFASICLLLAIWEAMGSPLRCLDEFDVFMDNVNRAISTNMLITAARRSVGRQYILITPNSIEGQAVKDKDVKIIRLTDPRQKTLTQQ